MPGLNAIARAARNIPNIGGTVFIDLFAENDFLATLFNFPTEAQVATGEISAANFAAALAAGNAPVRITADIESTSIKSESNGDFSSMSYEHGFETVINGDTLAQHVALQKLLNTPVLAVATMPNGTRKLLGTLQKPLVVTEAFTSGTKGSEAKNRKLVGKQQGTCEFGAPLLNAAVTYTVTA